ncbi:GNAT family N-acetyltransferase [Desertihabitans aurantiacus]|uniref:GNAT family N-acetyltransferase n=1 Tax=Desertihabitans aurantiacus TaxID=2282477 RepID=UPI000DF74AA4|nr:GNAT family N-acetyltransferase [Desertihabitans aurantiacus]
MSGDLTELPEGYPQQWEADVVLSDGGTAHLRPIRPEDASLLTDFYGRVSEESKFLRFFAPYPVLSPRDVRRFTHVDYVDRVALILTIRGEMVAVGRFDRLENDEAEVAFLVEDSQQGRGVGPLLLEHLAEAARERGITRFTAEVLPQNRAMVGVFTDAGYRVSRQLEDGVVQVDFPILPTDTSVGVMERREHRAEAASIRRLLTPERAVLIGPGRRLQRLGDAIADGPFTGELMALSTDGEPVQGVRMISSVTEVGEFVDLAVVAVGPDELGGVVIDVAHHGAKGMLVMGGPGPGHPGRTEVISLARAYGLRALGPDTLGLINTDDGVRLNATPAPMPRTGRVGLFSQSAAIGVVLLSSALEHNVGIANFLSTGPFSDVTANDVMQFWEDDERTAVCLLSLDKIGNPRKFTRIVRRLARRKPVVVFAPSRSLRSGREEELARPGAMAPPGAVDALFRQSGVIVSERRDAMYDLAKVLARQPLPAGPRVRVVTNDPTMASHVTAAAARMGLVPNEPVTLAADADGRAFVAAAQTALDDPSNDSVLCVVVGIYDTVANDAHGRLSALAATTAKPLVGVFVDFTRVARRAAGHDGPGQLPTYSGYGDALAALNAVSAYAHWRARDPGAVPLLELEVEEARRLVHDVLTDAPEGRTMTDDESAALLRAFGIRAVPRYRVDTLTEATRVAERLGWDVVLKATAVSVRGRPDLASVHRNLDDAADMAEAWADLGRLVNELGLGTMDDQHVAEPVVQAMMPPGVSLVVRSVEDPDFGPVISLGLAGFASDMLGDVVHRVPPLTDVDAAAMVRSLKAAPLLFGLGGSRGVDTGAVEDLLHRVAEMADLLPQLSEVVLTPCLASTRGVAVLGARVAVVPTRDVRDPQARAL